MKKHYLDNASTTYPKAPGVAEAVASYIADLGVNVARGGYQDAYEAGAIVYETRELINDLFHGPKSRNVVFTKNVTESLNILIKGLLKPGDHVLTSSMEHNAVMRPLTQLLGKGVSFSRIPCDPDGSLPEGEVFPRMEALLTDRTRAVVMMHASNVCGTVLPIAEVGRFCREHGLLFIVDSAQTAGVLPIDMEAMKIDALAFTGHKGLLGPQGIGGFLLTDEMIPLLEPLLSGGTGSFSHLETVPEVMPDRFECGTMNLPGIAGLHASLSWLTARGENGTVRIDAIREHEKALTARFLSRLSEPELAGRVRVVGKTGAEGRIGVVSLQTVGVDSAQTAFRLDDEYGIMTRVGLHCAPSAHKTLQTYPEGTVRFSFGYRNTEEEIDFAAKAIAEITA